jgi:hypothetical protein
VFQEQFSGSGSMRNSTGPQGPFQETLRRFKIVFDKIWLNAPADFAAVGVAEEFAHAYQYLVTTPSLAAVNDGSAPMIPPTQAIEFEAKMISMKMLEEAKLDFLPDEVYNGFHLAYAQMDQVYAEDEGERYISGESTFAKAATDWGKRAGGHYGSLPAGSEWKPVASEQLGIKPQNQSE